MAEFEAHANEEADAQHGSDGEDLFDEVVDRPVAEPRPAFIGREGLDIGFEPHDGAEEEAHHDEPVRGIDQRAAFEVGMAEDFDEHAAKARQGPVGTVQLRGPAGADEPKQRREAVEKVQPHRD